MSDLDEQGTLVAALLGIARVDTAEAATPPARSIGAEDGRAYRIPGLDEPVMVYAYDNQADAFTGQARLEAGVGASEFALATVNGTLLLWAHVTHSDAPTKDAIGDLASHFAGEE
jgi:hypothetical protein